MVTIVRTITIIIYNSSLIFLSPLLSISMHYNYVFSKISVLFVNGWAVEPVTIYWPPKARDTIINALQKLEMRNCNSNSSRY